MASTPVVCGCVIALALFLLQVVGVGTDYWLTVDTDGTGVGELSAGLFRVCAGAGYRVCYSYRNFATQNNIVDFNYYATTGLSVIGSILLFVNVIISFVGCARSRPARPTLQNLGGVWFPAGGCSIASVIWFYFSQNHDSKLQLSLTSLQLDIKLGYSFYMAAGAGVLSLITAIIVCVVARQMDPQQTTAASATPAGPQMFVMDSGVAQQGPTEYPQPGYAQPGYPQPGNPQPGYPQSGNLKQGYPQPGNPQPGYPQSGNLQPGYSQAGNLQPGYSQLGNLLSGYPQSGNLQPGYPQAGNLQPGYSQPGNLQPGYSQPGNLHPGYPQPGNLQQGYSQPGNLQPGFPQPGNLQQGYSQDGNIKPAYP